MKKGKRCEKAEKDYFNQPMASKAPVRWSKYTADTIRRRYKGTKKFDSFRTEMKCLQDLH